jgi:poly-beta-1,6-N-acetyl-D-glucosamine synthesis protein
MDKPGQRNTKREVIIQSKKNWFREMIITITSLAVWLYCLVVIIFFISAIFNYNNRSISLIKSSFKITNSDIRMFIFFAFLIWIFFYIGLFSWKFYNQKRFGSLNRRTYPEPTTKDDLLNLQLMSEENYIILQNSKRIVFEKNPIHELTNRKGER